MLKRLAIVALFALAACGGTDTPAVGDACSPENALRCASSTEALACEGGKLRAVTCRGPSGCVEGTATVVCDANRALVGDPCRKAQEGTGQCHAANANEALACRSGVWTAQACRSCAVQGDAITCLP